MKAQQVIVICLVWALGVSALPALADGAGKYPGKGSVEAYNRACRVGNKAVELAKKGNYAEAVKLDQEAIATYPYDSLSHHNLGNHLEHLGRLDEAIKEQQRAIELEPNMLAAWLSLGAEYEVQKKFKEAESCYRKSVRIKPDSYEALGDLGDILRQQGRFAEARPWLLKAIACPGSSVAPGEAKRKLAQCDAKDASP